jgi:hypothetical protein
MPAVRSLLASHLIATAAAQESGQLRWQNLRTGRARCQLADLFGTGQQALITPVTSCSACIFIHRGHAPKCALMPHSARLRGSVGLTVGHADCGSLPAQGVSARRRASGSRQRPAMRRTRSAASALGIPAAVTYNGRTEDLGTTGTAWVAVRNLDLATPITGMPNSACACAPRPGRPPGSRSA